MSFGSIRTIVCDECGQRELLTDGDLEGKPRASHLSGGWVEIAHRDPDDHLAITTSHYCPDHAGVLDSHGALPGSGVGR